MRSLHTSVAILLCAGCIGVGQPLQRSVRDVDFKHYLLTRNNLGKRLAREFGDANPIKDVRVQYGDLIGEGDEQAVVEATTCAMGNGGADIVEVFRMKADGQLLSLTMDDTSYKESQLYEGQTVTPRLVVKGGKLTRWFVMSAKGPAAGNPKAGLRRIITYRWSKDHFTIEAVIDVPDEGSGEPSPGQLGTPLRKQ